MEKRVLIVHTMKGHKYAWYIAKEVNLLGFVCEVVPWTVVERFINDEGWEPKKTIIHYRTTGPKIITPGAWGYHKKGYKVVNKPEVLERTGDKFLSYEWAKSKGVELPMTKKVAKVEVEAELKKAGGGKFVVKPVNSQGQGAYCFQISVGQDDIDEVLSKMPVEEVVLQEFVYYKRIFRVIVIDGKALRQAVFMDEPNVDRWKVSVCLNPEAKLVKNPPGNLIDYALNISRVFEVEVGFIDIYETDDGLVLSEINTACNLIQHERRSGFNISGEIAKFLVSQM